ncbi:uncharacterized protein BCR38DRAFT_352335 [Pseudomassariella vexata]|uniref:Uncharacterized protein n=1 Tax=Pseudomassariella vexata TaxID=1141098 RepID=A0A1Y2DHV9_9PEZI|nr:uncharacterized protein BCR38DRAFT_352335 [Pseudomassariella vexata]ORY58714.1 hypothetical protein BCR38DRAFT_352335 [Pseudomassariella vexata]
MSTVELQKPGPRNATLVGFVSDPDSRGTVSLLFSCILTLTLCVWSAVHLNLPKCNEKDLKYTWRYFKWSMLGVFGPELVVWTAWRQYISARALTKMVKEVRKRHAKKNVDASHKWTMVHGFYAGMGGFVFDMESPDLSRGRPFISQWRRLHVTPHGVQLLTECGLLPDIRREDIVDKSKTDATGKFICCIQAGWMLFQAATRVAVGLPVTPLEINTIGHVLCALATFILWWHKPRWVCEPTKLSGEWTRCICAFMYMCSQASAETRRDRDILRDFGVKSEISKVLYTPCIEPDDQQTPVKEEIRTHQYGSLVLRTSLPTNMYTMVQELPGSAKENTPQDAAETEMQRLRWKLVCEAVERFPAIQLRLEQGEFYKDESKYREALRLYPEMPQRVKEKFRPKPSQNRPTSQEAPRAFMPKELVIDHPRNWPGDDLLRQVPGLFMGLTLWVVSMAFGAVHVAGWHDEFPSSLESWLWRISSIYIVSSGLLWSLIHILAHTSRSVWWYWYDLLAGQERRPSHVIIFVLCALGGISYIFSRLYLVVEAFISLRALPADAYLCPSWLLSIPHL